MRSALLVLVAACAVGGFCVGVANVAAMLRGRAAPAQGTDALLVRTPDGRCWRAHGRVKYSNRMLSWRTDGGTTIHVHAADWIEVARYGGGIDTKGHDWRGAAATLGVDLGACLPAAESAP